MSAGGKHEIAQLDWLNKGVFVSVGRRRPVVVGRSRPVVVVHETYLVR